MCLSSSQILYSWIMQPNTLPPAYVRFLNRHGGKPTYCSAAIRELALSNGSGSPQRRLDALQGTRHAKFEGKIPCGFLHPGQSCNEHFLDFLPRSYARSLPVYLPVYLLPGILVHRQNLLKGPDALGIWQRLGLGAARSSLFLTLYCAMAWRGACLSHQICQTSTELTISTACLCAGLATLVEKKSRRMELALYCLSRAVESFALCLPAWGLALPAGLLPARLDVVLFSAATAAIMHCYSDSHGRHRDVFRSKYLNVLDFVFGNTGHEHGSIVHHPSTSELLELLEERLPIDTRALRMRAASLLVLPDLEHHEPEAPGTPRTSFSDPGITSFPSTTDEEYHIAMEPSLADLD